MDIARPRLELFVESAPLSTIWSPSDLGDGHVSATLCLSSLAVLAWIVIGGLMIQARRNLHWLKSVSPLSQSACPLVSVIIPARNEERNIQSALRSLLQQAYPNIEFIVVNDRSTDGTGAILERLARADWRLRLVTIRSLPEGWLGKNYALHRGAQDANGTFLLFTDADIVMHPQTLRKAMGYVLTHRLDHLTVAPDCTMPGAWLRTIAATFGFVLLIVFRPWKMRNPRSRSHMGIGAFNLVRAQAYRAVDGHRPIALRPDDDLKLAKLFKKHGYRQDILLGQDLISVEWYASVREMIQGLLKNTFAGVEYHISLVVLGTVLSLIVHLWPFIGVWATTGPAQWFAGLAVLLIMTIFSSVLTSQGLSPLHAPLFPAAIVLLLYIQWKAMLMALWSGGITWRGTHYPLHALKANKV